MKKIHVTQYGILGYYAHCGSCGWSDANVEDRDNLRRKVRKHVRNTGHRVAIEATRTTEYSLSGGLNVQDSNPN